MVLKLCKKISLQNPENVVLKIPSFSSLNDNFQGVILPDPKIWFLNIFTNINARIAGVKIGKRDKNEAFASFAFQFNSVTANLGDQLAAVAPGFRGVSVGPGG